MVVLIALFSLPLVSVALGSVGRAPPAGRSQPRPARCDRAVDPVAGVSRDRAFAWPRRLLGRLHGRADPCPLTLFVMSPSPRRASGGRRLRSRDDDRRSAGAGGGGACGRAVAAAASAPAGSPALGGGRRHPDDPGDGGPHPGDK